MTSAGEKFLFLGNEPALDLLNTTPVLAQGPVDFLEDFADLTEWMSAVGLLEESIAKALRRQWHGTSEADAAVTQAKQLREALREVLGAKLSGAKMPAGALGILNDALGAEKTTSQIEWNEKAGSFTRTFHHDTDGTPAQAVAILADAAARLLTEKDLTLVRRCENPACVLHFYDTSKNHRRRWCSMDICGNRIKVAAHYRRQRGEGR
jgi:predicted RNA-binding Zn ribbon-like protein